MDPDLDLRRGHGKSCLGNSGYGLISVPVTDAGGGRLKAPRGETDPEVENI